MSLSVGVDVAKNVNIYIQVLLSVFSSLHACNLQTCQLTPIKSVTHAFDITHTLTHINNSFTRTPPNLAARLKKSIMYTNLLTDASPCNRSTPCDVTGDVYMRTCGQMSWPLQV